jgi:hypothetical protein
MISLVNLSDYAESRDSFNKKKGTAVCKTKALVANRVWENSKPGESTQLNRYKIVV